MSAVERLLVHFCRYPPFRAALSKSDLVMWRRLDLMRQGIEWKEESND